MSVKNLTPEQIAFLRTLWRQHEEGVIERRRRTIRGVAIGIGLLFVVPSVVGIMNNWWPMVVWFFGCAVGTCAALAGLMRTNIRMWPAVEMVIDWQRLEAIVS